MSGLNGCLHPSATKWVAGEILKIMSITLGKAFDVLIIVVVIVVRLYSTGRVRTRTFRSAPDPFSTVVVV